MAKLGKINFSNFACCITIVALCALISFATLALTSALFIESTEDATSNALGGETNRSDEFPAAAALVTAVSSAPAAPAPAPVALPATVATATVLRSRVPKGKRAPAYLLYLYDLMASGNGLANQLQVEYFTNDEFDTNGELNQGHASHMWQRHPLLKAILPVKLKKSRKSTTVTFNLTKKNFDEFTHGSIILTRKDGFNLEKINGKGKGSLDVSIYVRIKNDEVKQSLKLRNKSKYYSFDVSNVLRHQAGHLGEDENSLDEISQSFTVECKISSNFAEGEIKIPKFHKIFDAVLEPPFILLRLKEDARNGDHHYDLLKNLHMLGHLNRARRSATVDNDAGGDDGNELKVSSKTTATGTSSLELPSTNSATSSSMAVSTTEILAGAVAPDATLQADAGEVETSVQKYGHDEDGNSSASPSSSPSTAVSAGQGTGLTVSEISPSSESTSPVAPALAGEGTTKSSSSSSTKSEERKQQPYPSFTPPSPSVCKRHDWVIKISDIKLDDVVRPEYLELGYCGGSCPFPLENDFFNFSLHSYFADQFRFYNGHSTPLNLEPSHCVAATYKKLMIMVKESDGGFLVMILPDGSVESCGCR